VSERHVHTPFLRNISFVLGESRPIEAIPALASDPKRLEAFRNMGFASFMCSQERASTMAVQAVRACLAEHELDPRSIDVIIYCSNTLGEADYFQEMHRSFDELGLSAAYPLGVHFSFCGNFTSGIRIASYMIKAGDAAAVLVVCADAMKGADQPMRLLEPTVAVVSDGASCCLVSNSAGAGPAFRILGTSQAVNHGISNLALEDIYSIERVRSPDFMWYSLARKRVGVQSAAAFMQRFAFRVEDFSALVTANYGDRTVIGLAAEAGVSQQIAYRANTAKYGHVTASDYLINLKTMGTSETSPTKGKVLVLSTGPYTWGYTGLEAAA
jgi:3-oxoacyl-[acyl-carrier-protein] synthase III